MKERKKDRKKERKLHTKNPPPQKKNPTKTQKPTPPQKKKQKKNYNENNIKQASKQETTLASKQASKQPAYQPTNQPRTTKRQITTSLSLISWVSMQSVSTTRTSARTEKWRLSINFIVTDAHRKSVEPAEITVPAGQRQPSGCKKTSHKQGELRQEPNSWKQHRLECTHCKIQNASCPRWTALLAWKEPTTTPIKIRMEISCEGWPREWMMKAAEASACPNHTPA